MNLMMFIGNMGEHVAGNILWIGEFKELGDLGHGD